MQKGEYVYRRAGFLLELTWGAHCCRISSSTQEFLLALTWADMPEKVKKSAKAALLRARAFADLVSGWQAMRAGCPAFYLPNTSFIASMKARSALSR